jgi:hypothetical protein
LKTFVYFQFPDVDNIKMAALHSYEETTALHEVKLCNKSLPDNLKGRVRLEDIGVDDRIILNFI